MKKLLLLLCIVLMAVSGCAYNGVSIGGFWLDADISHPNGGDTNLQGFVPAIFINLTPVGSKI